MNREDFGSPMAQDRDMEVSEGKTNRFALELFWLTMALILGFSQWIVPTLNDLIPGMRSEYRPLEILSRTFLLTGLLGSAVSMRRSLSVAEYRIGAAFFVMLLGMVLSEGNFLPNTVLPVFVLPLGIYLFLKLRGADKSACRSLVAAAVVLSMGFAADIIDDLLRAMKYNLIGTFYIPAVLEEFSKFEELYETIGAVLVVQAAILASKQRIFAVTDGAKPNSALGIAFVSLLVLSTGNALLHFQYEPGLALRVVGTLLSFAGAVGVLYFDTKHLDGVVFRIKRAGLASACLFVGVFVMLPLVHGTGSRILSVLFWVPVLSAVTYYLLIYRSSESAKGESVRRQSESRGGRAA